MTPFDASGSPGEQRRHFVPLLPGHRASLPPVPRSSNDTPHSTIGGSDRLHLCDRPHRRHEFLAQIRTSGVADGRPGLTTVGRDKDTGPCHRRRRRPADPDGPIGGKAGDGKDGYRGGRELIPRLARTYRGHSGYVHSVAVLGALSDPIGTDDHHGPGDHGGRRGKRDDGLTQSDHGPGLRGAFRRRTGRLSRSLTQEEASYISGELREGGSRSTEISRSTASYTPSAVGRRMSQLSLDSSGGGGMGTKLLFVSASRDNTLRIWPIDDDDERRQGVSFSDDPAGVERAAAGWTMPGPSCGDTSSGRTT